MIQKILTTIYVFASVIIVTPLVWQPAQEITNQIPALRQLTQTIQNTLSPINLSSNTPKYQSDLPARLNQVVVKYVDDARGFSILIDKLYQQQQPLVDLTGSTELDQLHATYQVQKIERVFDSSVYDLIPNKAIYTIADAISIKAQVINAEQIRLGQIREKNPLRSRATYNELSPVLSTTFTLTLPAEMDVQAFAKEYAQSELVQYAEPVQLNTLQVTPNDTRFGELYGLQSNKMNIQPAWDIAQGNGQIVAVIDTGLDTTHPDIQNQLWTNSGEIPNNGLDDDQNGYIDDVHGFDISDGDGDPTDSNGHGSHVSGTIAATINNAEGIAGVAPQAQIMTIKVFPQAYDTTLAEAIMYAVDNGAVVLNNSWGPDQQRLSNPVVQDAIDYAVSLGAVVVFAAGNSTDDVAYYAPANYPKVITVAATNQNDERASFSNYGSPVDIAAPGVDILSLKIGGGYQTLDGTSMASPHIAGVAALIKQKYPALSPDDVQQVLRTRNDQLMNQSFSQQFGYGRADALAVLQGQILPFPTAYIDNVSHNQEIKDTLNITATNDTQIQTWEFRHRALNTAQWISLSGIKSNTTIQDSIDTNLWNEGWHYVQLETNDNNQSAFDTKKVYVNNKIDKTDLIKFLQGFPPLWIVGAFVLIGLIMVLSIGGLFKAKK
jgi:thermitase